MSTAPASGSRSACTSRDCSSAATRSRAARRSAGVSARITPRLPESTSGLMTHGNGTPPRSSRRHRRSDRHANHGTGRPAAASRSRARRLLWRRPRAADRMVRKAERRSGLRRNRHGTIADREQAGKRRARRFVEDRRNRSRLVVEADRHGPVPPRILEGRAAIRRERHLDAEAVGGLAEGPGLVPGRRREQENAWVGHGDRCRCSATGYRLRAAGGFRP